MPPREAALLGLFGRLKSIVKHRIWGGGLVSSIKTGEPTSTIYTSHDVFCGSSCLLVVAMIAPALKFLVALIFNRD